MNKHLPDHPLTPPVFVVVECHPRVKSFKIGNDRLLKHNCGLHRNVALLVLSVEIPSLGSVFVSSFISAEIRCNLGTPNEILH